MALMDPMQRTSMVRSLQRLASGQDVSRDELQMLASFGPTAKFTQDKIFEKYHNNPEVAQLFEAMKQTGPMSPTARKELEIKTFFDLGIAEAEATKIAKKISDEMMPNMIKLINDKLKGDLRIQESRNQMANAAQAE
jgi:deoxyxylulose-5-phosphate synthase